MPSEAHDLRDNPLYTVLKDKERKQLRGAPAGALRCIFLGDAGNRLLMNIQSGRTSHNTVSGREIIQTFLAESAIDIVCVFSPQRMNEYVFHDFDNPRVWKLMVFDRRADVPKSDFERLDAIRALLPKPYLHGYQARSWQQQGMLNPQGRGVYHATQYSGGRGKMTVKISARGLHELLAGRVTQQHWLDFLAGDNAIFENMLKSGKTISGAHGRVPQF